MAGIMAWALLPDNTNLVRYVSIIMEPFATPLCKEKE